MSYNKDTPATLSDGGRPTNVGAYIRVSTVFEEQDTSDWIKMAEKARAKRGEFTGSFDPYGYDKIGKTLVIANDESPDVVRRIFDMYQQGIGMQTIANILTDEKVSPPAERQNRENVSSDWHQTDKHHRR